MTDATNTDTLPVIHKERDNALIPAARPDAVVKAEAKYAAVLASTRAKVDAGISLTRADINDLLHADGWATWQRVKAEMRAKRETPGREHAVLFSQGTFDSIGEGVYQLNRELTGIRAAIEWEILDLQQRLAALEAATERQAPRPRIRVAAGGERWAA